MKSVLLGLLSLAFCQTSCTMTKKGSENNANKSFLALGDSYTIGESVDLNERWPNQLVYKLRQDKIYFKDPLIIGKTGWRADQTLAAAKDQLVDEKFDLVSILIGVNNQFQGESIKEFEKDFKDLVELGLKHAKNGKSSLFVLSIPDYGYTPFAKGKGTAISKDLKRWNDKIKELCDELGLTYFNITPISQEAKKDTELIAKDGLHPSGKMYGLWVDLMLDKIKQKLQP